MLKSGNTHVYFALYTLPVNHAIFVDIVFMLYNDAMLYNSSSKVLKSVHGKSLLRELSDRQARLERVLEILNKEPNAGRLRDPETGFSFTRLDREASRGRRKAVEAAVLMIEDFYDSSFT